MDMQALLQLGCGKIATWIKGTPVKKIREILESGKPVTQALKEAEEDAAKAEKEKANKAANDQKDGKQGTKEEKKSEA